MQQTALEKTDDKVKPNKLKLKGDSSKNPITIEDEQPPTPKELQCLNTYESGTHDGNEKNKQT